MDQARHQLAGDPPDPPDGGHALALGLEQLEQQPLRLVPGPFELQDPVRHRGPHESGLDDVLEVGQPPAPGHVLADDAPRVLRVAERVDHAVARLRHRFHGNEVPRPLFFLPVGLHRRILSRFAAQPGSGPRAHNFTVSRRLISHPPSTRSA